ncbi:hypothetical protein OIU79_015905 [Salix purpurea]|uniref:Uncharacterized protein n=1 Tax=Salix purpurea TaxID=77065 RepID=A0A9Q0PD25_SALPP|nr:hypothetical protein OIU79_015905 [Salix purpurea]
MVFRSIPATHPNTSNIVMASSTTVKPHQPLHNFPLQDLKWSMNPSNNATNHHRSRCSKSPHRDAAADLDGDGGIFIRLRTNKNCSGSSSSKCMVDDVAADAGDLDSAAVVEDVEESMPKTWNLRPRRAVNKGLNGSGGTVKIGGGAVQEIKSQEKEKVKEKEKEKEKKLRFSIPLTREEIEEDIYSLTGSKPARRSKKRAKHVQKQLDCLFPGMWLASITPECYKVHEAPSKLRM